MSLTQLQAPSAGFELVTARACSTAARSWTVVLNRTMIGMPTPTDWPPRGEIEVTRTLRGATVAKNALRSAVTPSVSTAAATSR